jgi:hypothetical protein
MEAHSAFLGIVMGIDTLVQLSFWDILDTHDAALSAIDAASGAVQAHLQGVGDASAKLIELVKQGALIQITNARDDAVRQIYAQIGGLGGDSIDPRDRVPAHFNFNDGRAG